MSFLRVFVHSLLVGREDFKLFWNWKTWLGAWMLRATTLSMSWALLGRLVGSEPLVDYLILGNSIGIGCSAVAWTIPAATWDRADGTYAFLVVSPSSIVPSIVGRTIVWALNGMATSVATLGALSLIFYGGARPAPLVPFLATVVCTCLSTYAMCLFFGAIFNPWPKLRNVVLGLVGVAIATFSGVSVPVTFWPPRLQSAIQLMPVAHGLDALRQLIVDAQWRTFAGGIGLEMAVGMAWLVVALVILQCSAWLSRYFDTARTT